MEANPQTGQTASDKRGRGRRRANEAFSPHDVKPRPTVMVQIKPTGKYVGTHHTPQESKIKEDLNRRFPKEDKQAASRHMKDAQHS